MEATPELMRLAGGARDSGPLSSDAKPRIWQMQAEELHEPRSAAGLVIAVGLSLGVWVVIALALFV
ncbi:hypothetical protein B2G71_21455 [Novosphingobium sp. PC22D]|nr:hypothetical protein B2G71_21455 [Novosphingobium sp. PC22D]